MSGIGTTGGAPHDPPQATFTAGGICHNMPLEGCPHTGDVMMRNGVPAVPVSLGTVAGRQITLDVMSLAELDALDAALLRARVVLMMWQQDHREPDWMAQAAGSAA